MDRCPTHNIELTTGGCIECSRMSVANNPTTLGDVRTATLKFVSPDYHGEVVERLTRENENLRKWFAYLVEFIHNDQCRPSNLDGPPEKCWCCSDYLEVAKHAAKQGGVLASVHSSGAAQSEDAKEKAK